MPLDFIRDPLDSGRGIQSPSIFVVFGIGNGIRDRYLWVE